MLARRHVHDFAWGPDGGRWRDSRNHVFIHATGAVLRAFAAQDSGLIVQLVIYPVPITRADRVMRACAWALLAYSAIVFALYIVSVFS